MTACAKSWGSLSAGWWWCSLDRGHAGPCSCAGRLKRDDELYFSEQPEASEFLRKQAERQAKEDAR